MHHYQNKMSENVLELQTTALKILYNVFHIGNVLLYKKGQKRM